MPQPRTPRLHVVPLHVLLDKGLLVEDVDFTSDGRVIPSALERAERTYSQAPDDATLRPKTAEARVRPGRVQIRRTGAQFDSTACLICLNNVREFAFQPCWHVVACSACQMRLHKCPICRTVIQKVQRIYLS